MITDSLQGWLEVVGAALGAITAAIGAFIASKPIIRYFKKRGAVKREETFNTVNMRISDLLGELRMKSKGSRVSLTQFHNGGKFADGSSMRRMSISHQSCDPKISSTMQFRQDVLVSRFVEIIQQLRENNPHIRNVSSLFESNTKKFYELHDTTGFSILPLFCSDSLVVYGYITIEWCDLQTIDNVDETDVKSHMEYTRDQVSFLLNSAKDYR
jgi:hypothetical protein